MIETAFISSVNSSPQGKGNSCRLLQTEIESYMEGRECIASLNRFMQVLLIKEAIVQYVITDGISKECYQQFNY